METSVPANIPFSDLELVEQDETGHLYRHKRTGAILECQYNKKQDVWEWDHEYDDLDAEGNFLSIPDFDASLVFELQSSLGDSRGTQTELMETFPAIKDKIAKLCEKINDKIVIRFETWG
tara:strand:+ start:92 stop:451 length:360 start_codon:yes stop_codon:yes gene_type:complete